MAGEGHPCLQRLWLHHPARGAVGQSVRNDGPQTHLVKAGTPTMGGALILIAVASSTLLWADLSNRFVWIAVLATLARSSVSLTASSSAMTFQTLAGDQFVYADAPVVLKGTNWPFGPLT